MTEVRAKLLSAFQNLPIHEHAIVTPEDAVNLLMSIASVGAGNPSIFQDIGLTRIEEELRALSKPMSSLADLITIHQPTILLLADNGFNRGTDQTVKHMQTAAKHAMKSIASMASAKIKGGRPSDLTAKAVGTIAASYYFLLTNKRPGRVYDAHKTRPVAEGPYMMLIKEVLTALDIDANREHVARASARQFKAARPSRKK